MTTTAIVPFTWTQESITVVLADGPRTIHRGSPQYHLLRDALFAEQWDSIPALVTVEGALRAYLKGTPFVVEDGTLKYEGIEVPDSLTARMGAMAATGEDPTPLMRFYARLAKNPSYRSRTQLHEFMCHVGIPIEADGTFLAYKGVKNDLYDVHSGKFLNAPGEILTMPRNAISDDPDVGCHVGFHVGALEYAAGFGERVVICRVDPEHVVSVPRDSSFQKMRVCRYEVVGFWAGEALPSTTYTSDVDEDYEDDEYPEKYQDEDEDEGAHVELAAPVVEVKPEPEPVLTVKPSPRMAKLTPSQLMDEPIEALRKYATHGLKIVGASKMPGGKSALVAAIVKARRKAKR